MIPCIQFDSRHAEFLVLLIATDVLSTMADRQPWAGGLQREEDGRQREEVALLESALFSSGIWRRAARWREHACEDGVDASGGSWPESGGCFFFTLKLFLKNILNLIQFKIIFTAWSIWSHRPGWRDRPPLLRCCTWHDVDSHWNILRPSISQK